MKNVFLGISIIGCLTCTSCMGHKTDASNVTDSTNLAQDISTDSGEVKHDSSAMKKGDSTAIPKDSGANSKGDSVKAIRGK
jgi:hypothetical protein